MVNGRAFALSVISGAGVSVQLALAGRAVASTGSATEEATQSGIAYRDGLAARSVAAPRASGGARPGDHGGALNWVGDGGWASVLAEAVRAAWRPAIRR